MKRTFAAMLLIAMFAMTQTAYADDGESATQRSRDKAYATELENQDKESVTVPKSSQEGSGAPDLRFKGSVDGNGKTFTWYSEKVLPGGGLDALNSNGRHVGDGGYVMDADGYIAIASPWGIDPIGTVIDTPWGQAKVYDVCEDDSYDVYVSW